MKLFECKHSLFLPRYGEADNRVYIHKGSMWTKSNDRINGIGNSVKLENDNKWIEVPKEVFELYFRRANDE